MAEHLEVSTSANKEARYKTLLPQVAALIETETDLTANLANAAAALRETFGFFWVGFYLVKPNQSANSGEELVLGPFQGPIACTRIALGKGVCGTAWKEKETIVVPNVDEFPGHIACSSASKSEIVVPFFNRSGAVVLVLDVDSDVLNDFDSTDKKYLEEMAAIFKASL